MADDKILTATECRESMVTGIARASGPNHPVGAKLRELQDPVLSPIIKKLKAMARGVLR